MGDTKISYDEQFGIRTFKREICSELGEPFWLELTDGLVLPDMETEAGCKCCNMHTFICRLEAMADEKLYGNSLQSAAWNTSVSVCVGKGRVS